MEDETKCGRGELLFCLVGFAAMMGVVLISSCVKKVVKYRRKQ